MAVFLEKKSSCWKTFSIKRVQPMRGKVKRKWSIVLLSGLVLLGAFSCRVFLKYKRLHHQCDLVVMGPIEFADGIGRQAVGLIDCLKHSCSIQYIRQGSCDFKDVPASVKRIAKQKYKKKAKVLIYEPPILNGSSSIFPSLPNVDIRIAYSMFESTKIPQEWVIVLNNLFDAVVVPDSFLVDVYRNSGVRIPVFIVPLGMRVKSFLKQSFVHSKPVDRPFVFGALGSVDSRKNQRMLVRAFAKEFGNNPNVKLLINGRRMDREYLAKIKGDIELFKLNNVSVTAMSLKQRDYLRLLKSLDCYVSPSKGEGFSLQPREALALGLPSIVADNTAQKTICQSGYVCSVPSQIIVKAVYDGWRGLDLGDQFGCKVNDLAAALRDVYDNYDLYAQKAFEGRSWVEQYEYEQLRKFYETLVSPKEVVLSDRDEVAEGVLYTTSQKLKQSYEMIQEDKTFKRRLCNALIIKLFQG
ncbi:MAG: glycosyltransferase family 4 protein [Verrucomicrobiota bacterium]|nr:glycosyltransferase family 4 protein [Verrucomicrobiota bacterium]